MAFEHPYVYMPNQSINPFLLCCICHHPFVDPVNTTDGRHGCRACFTGNLSYQAGTLTAIEERIVLEMLNGLLVICTQCREENIPRGSLSTHASQSCRRALVACEAADIKCPWRGVREDLNGHMQQCVFEPLRPALSEVLRKNRELKQQLEHLENVLNTLIQRH
ncbi:unnamed protein product [Rotaria socialis]|uniref:Uncharacterized protein n=1 Tax=Rotaria socialis TaxID=392032 RepID=A0A820UTB8_9BILA|nr:unnamed protein product [Rotaria socialis]CAF3315372.1 unnamed protein product [Rotaria socialis]CAF3465327.1 unnamed protein product [Rotaria socialis]CAF4442358.1 unnamed protein product [Rotaria socialis]CAF4490315.1 unnamed protein product [Rotaria socialis]